VVHYGVQEEYLDLEGDAINDQAQITGTHSDGYPTGQLRCYGNSGQMESLDFIDGYGSVEINNKGQILYEDTEQAYSPAFLWTPYEEGG
jgi:hypothetical protein